MQKMNEQDMDYMLGNMAIENEKYTAKVWAVVMSMNNSKQSALNNKYCYLGLTQNTINIVMINSFNIKSIENQITVPLNTITKVKVKKSFIPQRRIVIIETDSYKMKISVMLNSIGADLPKQKDYAELLFERLLNINS